MAVLEIEDSDEYLTVLDKSSPFLSTHSSYYKGLFSNFDSTTNEKYNFGEFLKFPTHRGKYNFEFPKCPAHLNWARNFCRSFDLLNCQSQIFRISNRRTFSKSC